MATEKYFVFSESGELKRMKGRIVRFLDNEDPTGSDKSAIRTSLEVSPDAAGLVQADVGTAPNEIPVNGMLGDMAYQSSDGVSAAKLEVESTTGTATTQALTVTDGSSTNFVVQEDGNVGIGNNSPSSYHPSADDLVVGDTSGHRGMTIVSGSGNSGSIYFADGTSGDALYRGYIGYNQGSNLLNFGTAATTQWQINNSGNLVAYAAGVGIDFGSGDTLDDYETGTVTVGVTCDSGSITLNSSFQYLYYTKIGRTVNLFGELVVDSVSSPSGAIHLTGLPFTALNQSATAQAMNIYTRGLASDLGSVIGFVLKNTTNLYLRESGTTGVGHLIANAFQSGTELMVGGSYTAA